MDCSRPETMPSFDRRRAAEELLHGRELAQQLQLLLQRSGGYDSMAPSQDLLYRILTSFSKALSMLNRSSDCDDVNGSTVNPSEDSCESSKSSTFKDRRGCYKRRKTAHSWTRESSSLIDDGYAWRKYGQKVILNAKYPRNYFRCTHKFDQGCQATKQVQRVEEDPPKYSTTYYSHHTCTSFLKPSEIVLDPNFNDSSVTMLRFDSPIGNIHQNPIFKSFPLEETVGQNQGSSSSNYIMTPEDHATVCSSMPILSSCSLDQSEQDVFSEVIMGSVVDFNDDDLQFDF